MARHVLTVRELRRLLSEAIEQGFGDLAVAVQSTDVEGYSFYESDLTEWICVRDGMVRLVTAKADDDAASERREGE